MSMSTLKCFPKLGCFPQSGCCGLSQQAAKHHTDIHSLLIPQPLDLEKKMVKLMDWHKDRLIRLILLLVKSTGDLLLRRQCSPASAISSELCSCSVGHGVLLRTKELPCWQWMWALAPQWSVCTETTAQELCGVLIALHL